MAIASANEYGARKRQGCIPMDVKTILDVMKKDKPYMVRDEEVESISVVAKVIEFHEGGGSIDVILMDHSGTIGGKIFKKSGSTLVKPLINYEYVQNAYVYAVGGLMNFDGNHTVVLTRMTNVLEFAFVIMHRTQTMWAYLIRNRLIHVTSNETILTNLSNKFTEVEEDPDKLKGLNNDQKVVMKFINQTSYGGLRKTQIFKDCGFSVERAKLVLEQLVEFGFIYCDQDCEVYYLS